MEALEPFGIDTLEQAGRIVVVPRGELDIASAPELERAVLPALREGRWLVLDLRSLDFIDSSGLRVVLSAHHAVGEGEGRFTVVRGLAATSVRRIVEIAGIDSVIEMVDSPDELDGGQAS